MTFDIVRYARQKGLTTIFTNDSLSAQFEEARSTHKCLLLYLHSRENRGAVRFFKDVLHSSVVSDVLRESFIVWGTDASSENSIRIADSLSVTGYPAIAIISPASESLRAPIIVYSECKTMPPRDVFVSMLCEVKTNVSNAIDDSAGPAIPIMDIDEDDMYDSVGYQSDFRAVSTEALGAPPMVMVEDVPVHVHPTPPPAAITPIPAAAPLPILPPEPATGVNIRFRLPDNSTAQRRFDPTDTCEMLYAFLDSMDLDSTAHTLCTSFPRKDINRDAGPLGTVIGSGPVALVVRANG